MDDISSKRCPECGKVYRPVLVDRPQVPGKFLVQDRWPTAQPWEREQLISGICSDRCFDSFLGEED